MQERDIFTDAEQFEARLGLPNGFYLRLLEEDDWSFVIKLNALFEGACTHALVARLRAPEIEEQLAQIELADTAKGKVKLLSTLGCITSQQGTFLRKLAELRNTLVHNVSRVAFDYKQHVGAMDPNQIEQFVKVFGSCWTEQIEVDGRNIPRKQFALENPKLSVWSSAAEVLACLYLEFELAEWRFKNEVLREYQKLVAGGA